MGGPQRQELIESQAQGVYVAAPIGLTPKPFGGHVAQRADHVAAARQVLHAGDLRQAEIANPGGPAQI